MNCEKYQDLLSDFIDGSLASENYQSIETHLGGCTVCTEVRGDLDAIVNYCHAHRGEYEPVPNERALWLLFPEWTSCRHRAKSSVALPLHRAQRSARAGGESRMCQHCYS